MSNLKEELNKSIDFDLVLNQISSFASFSRSKEEIQGSLPLKDRILIMQHLDLVREGIEFIRKGSVLNMSGCRDVSDVVNKASKNMVLYSTELSDITNFLGACRLVYHAFDETYPLLNDRAQSMNLCRDLFISIQNQIDMTGAIKEGSISIFVTC